MTHMAHLEGWKGKKLSFYSTAFSGELDGVLYNVPLLLQGRKLAGLELGGYLDLIKQHGFT